ncbi:MAG: prephenate dehydrogenase [Pseudomonadota bacterium]|nr:prephenate dehydrogenase [Xanthomonadaceae bacterium]MDE2248287.1 prephenate dehydrogenase [Xanthomonadaceae bacterium]MDE3210108.1 prephenate dehydrogenase [Pseudomonadota bacterium]
MDRTPVIGIVGSRGAYGLWLARFFRERMGLQVIGRDPAGDTALDERALIERADVLVFSAPIRATPALIAEYVRLAAGAERGRLWLDITSIKSTPVAALLTSQAEVVGLHPMCAPPHAPTLTGRAMVVCEARLDAWRPWLARFLEASQADCVLAEPEQHDRMMALVQGMVHAGHMAQGALWRELAPTVGGLAAIAPFHTVGYELDLAVTQRMLAGNPAIYQDIQFENPHVAPMLDRLADHVSRLRDLVRESSDSAREQMRRDWLEGGAAFFGPHSLERGSRYFERMAYLLADLAANSCLEVMMPADRPGSLRALLSIFEQHGINFDSIHSSRVSNGELRFRLGLDAATRGEDLAAAVVAMQGAGIARLLPAA